VNCQAVKVHFKVHPDPVLRSTCVPENVGVNKKLYPHKKQRLQQMQIYQPKGVKTVMRKRKLRNCVNWQGALKKKDVK